ncbi:MAG: DUF2333 family protein [Alphaproteobacteria bacterium]|nr:DUF2333 family protein [Alphaproteobacteria bacterium]
MAERAPTDTVGPEVYDVDEKARSWWRQRWFGRPGSAAPSPGQPGSRRWIGRALGAGVVALVLYYVAGMVIIHAIDDDLAFIAPPVPERASRSVAVTAALIDREVNRHRWTANDPFFIPSALLDNMPNFQQGIVAALARFSFELTDQIGRTRGSSQIDSDLQEAAGLLQYSGKKWVFDFSTSLAPTATSEAQYRKARRALLQYKERLARGEAVFDRRADNLLATLDRFASDLGSSSASLQQRLAVGSALFDTDADDVFYHVKGQLYAYYVLLRELGQDYDRVIRERDLEATWKNMLESMALAAKLQPMVVFNGAPDAQFVPSHLAAQGFFLLRARTKLREITNILKK